MAPHKHADLRRHCQRRLKAMRAERQSWEPHWRELSDNILPRRGRFLYTPNAGDRGRKLNGRIVNSTGTLAARTLGAGLVSGVTSPARPWFRLTLSDKKLARLPAVRAWLDSVQDVLLRIFAASNFYNAIGVAYEELGVFGTAAIVVLEDYEDVVRFYTLTIGEYFLAASHRGAVDTLYREFPLSVAALVQEYGLDKVSAASQRKYENGDLDTEVMVVHAIEPNDSRVIDVPDADNMPWRSVHYEVGGDSEARPLLRVGGYRHFCVMAPRWNVTGNDVYGRGPGMDALPDVKALQAMEKDKARAIQLLVKPPMVAPSQLRNEVASLLPGSITYVASGAGGATEQFRPAFQANPRIAELQADIAAKAQQVTQAFYADLFLAISRLDDVRSATEIVERREEKLLQLGPMLERLHDELLDPLIKRVLDIAGQPTGADHSVLPPRPKELRGHHDIEVDYVSTLSVAQKAVGTASIERFVAFVGNLAGARPEVLDKIAADDTVEAYGDLLAVPSALIVDNDTVARTRAERAQAQQMQQAMQQGLAAVQGAKVLADTPVGGGKSALNIVTGMS